MEPDNFCKGCQGQVRLEDEEITRIFNEKIKVKSVKLVDETVYQNRLAICNQCSYLDYGTTCRHCGCIVQIKAKLVAASCPFPKNSKWQ